jgi:hypothetical protein
MSVPVRCDECGDTWEVAWGEDPDPLCGVCKRRKFRLDRGGLSLSGKEKAAVASLFDCAIADETALEVSGRSGRMVYGSGGCIDYGYNTELTVFDW